MRAVGWLIGASVRNRAFVLIGVLVFAATGVMAFRAMTFDAFPDLTNVQVQVLTTSPGMGSREVELLVTTPVERALNGTPGLVELRSISRTGISAITAVFEDGTDRQRARQFIKERLDAARGEIPESAGAPEVAPPTTGLGEVYQFTVTSDRHSLAELTRIFERDVSPRLRAVPGVVEVNVWGGGAPQLDVVADPFLLAAHGVTVLELESAVAGAIGLEAGGARVSGAEQTLVRGVANPVEPQALGAIAVRETDGGTVRVRDLARVGEGRGLTVGMGSTDGRGEGLFVMVQLLAGADALSVVRAVRERAGEVRAGLPEGVSMEAVYDREKLVGSTLRTVAFSLTEGGLLVILVLLLVLGDLRAGLIVASVIPLSMLGAFTGLYVLGYSGNLMSLGAIDFGLIVDGTIVVTESIVALTMVRGDPRLFGEAVADRARRVARPVLFAVVILLLVYTPVLLMWGTEGKLFRPMALTVLLALFTALVLTFTYVPAIASWVIKPRGEHQTALTRFLARLYAPLLRGAIRRPLAAAASAAAIFALSLLAATQLGIEFVPRLEEGDLVIQTTRLPSLSPEQALREATRVERIVREFPEVQHIASRTGAPALATDPMGLEEADILVQLAPKSQWTTASTTEGLVEAISARLAAEAPGAEFNFTQPIEMRFNELLEGITSDVGVKVFGPDQQTLLTLGAEVAVALKGVDGAADVLPPTLEGVPGVDVVVDEAAVARAGVDTQQLLSLVAGVQRGREVGRVTRGQFRDPVMIKVALPPDMPLEDMPVVLPDARSVPLSELAQVHAVSSPARIDRESGSRRVVVKSNVRGRDLGSFVTAARQAVEAQVTLPDGYWLEWSGKYEQLRTAATRTGIMLPLVLFLILGILYVAFDGFKPALLIFLNVPVATSGGLLILWARDLPLSMSAIVGFIALFGVAVMNGIVLLSRTIELRRGPGALSAAAAALSSAEERFRPVLMTALVAGIGFVPMAIATGVGAEVQRPLATVVIGGLVTSTWLTLVVLPALYARFFRAPSTPPDDAPVRA